MAGAIPFITLGISAATSAAGVIQNADAQGEQQKQMAAQQTALNAELSAQQAQETQLTEEQQNNNTRDAQLTSEQTIKAQQGSTVTADSSYSGPSVFGTTGYSVGSKSGTLFGGI